MNRGKSPKTEKIAVAMIGFGTTIILIGLFIAFFIFGMRVILSGYEGVDTQSSFFATWLIMTSVVGPYFAVTGFYFRLVHQRIPTFLKPVGLILPILLFLIYMQGFLDQSINDIFAFFSTDLYENIILELLGGLITAWILYFGFELYREEEQEIEHKQLLFELKSIREELELIKQQNQQPIVVQSPAPSFITRLIHRFRRS
ncbi:MAG: hypothetical protein H6653_07900 [Ardenticatenaceae bacterium]|nr:hypothetical protein [Ardenticatenaceae bacterium]